MRIKLEQCALNKRKINYLNNFVRIKLEKLSIFLGCNIIKLEREKRMNEKDMKTKRKK